MNPMEHFETSMLGHMGVLFALVKRHIGQVSSKTGRFFGRTFMIQVFVNILNLEMEI